MRSNQRSPGVRSAHLYKWTRVGTEERPESETPAAMNTPPCLERARQRMQPVKICHVTSVHDKNDSRIFYRECLSLKRAGFDVHLIAPADEDSVDDGVIVHAVPKFSSRLLRMLICPLAILRKLAFKKYKLVHFHDPELIWVGIVLRISGKKVIFDVHENIAEQITSKDWLPLRKLIAKLYIAIDYISAKCFVLILAELSYVDIYKQYTSDYHVILNYPDIDLLAEHHVTRRDSASIFYIGGVSKERGIDTVLNALHLLHSKNIYFEFHCVGTCSPALLAEIREWNVYQEISDRVVFYGRRDIKEGYKISQKCILGISILKPIGNYRNSYSTKIFEYMAVGMPVITSDFQLYRDVVQASDCGICVDPEDPCQLANALGRLLTDHQEAQRMGQNGRMAVERIYNWRKEDEKLLALYRKLLAAAPS